MLPEGLVKVAFGVPAAILRPKPFQQIGGVALTAKFVALAFVWLPSVSVASGIGSQSWGENYDSGGYTTEGMGILAVLLAILAIASVLVSGSKKVRIILAITIGIPVALCIAYDSTLFGFLVYPMFFVALWVSDRVAPPSEGTKGDVEHIRPKDVTLQAPSPPVRTTARPIQSVTAKETKSVAEYVAKKNAAEMIKLAGVPPVKVVADTAKPVQRTDPIIQHRSELTEKVADIAQQRPHRPQVAPSFPNLKGLAWIKECAPFYAQDVEDFGGEFVNYIGRQSDKTHWHMRGKGSDFAYLSACTEVNFKTVKDDFGDDLVDLIKRVAQHYFDDHDWLYSGRFKEPITLESDVDNFGSDLVAMADRVISFVYATQLIKDIQPLPFSVGAKVSHKIKGEAFGIGEILKRNDQYLTVEFPAVQKRFDLVTETAGNFLMEGTFQNMEWTAKRTLPKHMKPLLPEVNAELLDILENDTLTTKVLPIRQPDPEYLALKARMIALKLKDPEAHLTERIRVREQLKSVAPELYKKMQDQDPLLPSPKSLQEALDLNPHSKGPLPRRMKPPSPEEKKILLDHLKVIKDEHQRQQSQSNAHLSPVEFRAKLEKLTQTKPREPQKPNDQK